MHKGLTAGGGPMRIMAVCWKMPSATAMSERRFALGGAVERLDGQILYKFLSPRASRGSSSDDPARRNRDLDRRRSRTARGTRLP